MMLFSTSLLKILLVGVGAEILNVHVSSILLPLSGSSKTKVQSVPHCHCFPYRTHSSPLHALPCYNLLQCSSCCSYEVLLCCGGVCLFCTAEPGCTWFDSCGRYAHGSMWIGHRSHWRTHTYNVRFNAVHFHTVW